MAVVDWPVTFDKVRGSEPKRAAAFSSSAKVNASLPNSVKLPLECGDVDALTAITEHWAMFRLGADRKVYLHRELIDFRAGNCSVVIVTTAASRRGHRNLSSVSRLYLTRECSLDQRR